MIREATIDDIPDLIRMGIVMCQESPTFSRYKPDYKRQYAMFLDFITDDDGLVLIAEDATAMFVGHVDQMLWFEDVVASEELLFVMPEQRKTARGVRMVEMFEAWAREKGANEVHVGIMVKHHVAETTRFYERLGYEYRGTLFEKRLEG